MSKTISVSLLSDAYALYQAPTELQVCAPWSRHLEFWGKAAEMIRTVGKILLVQ